MDQTETEFPTKVQIALLSFVFRLVETHVRSRELSLNLLRFKLHVQSTQVETLAVVWPLTLVNRHSTLVDFSALKEFRLFVDSRS